MKEFFKKIKSVNKVSKFRIVRTSHEILDEQFPTLPPKVAVLANALLKGAKDLGVKIQKLNTDVSLRGPWGPVG